MTRKTHRNAGAPRSADPATPDFDPVPRRDRHDGWNAERQVGFIKALAECGCVEEACARVGMSVSSAYRLRRAEHAASFRIAWDMALDMAIDRLADAAFARAMRGVSRPVFYQGEQVGERRHYDERLTMFLLRYRRPERYGAHIDRCEARRDWDGVARDLHEGLRRVTEEATDDRFGDGRIRQWTPPAPLRVFRPDPKKNEAAIHYVRRSQEEVDAALLKLCERLAEHEDRQKAEAAAAEASGGGVAAPS